MKDARVSVAFFVVMPISPLPVRRVLPATFTKPAEPSTPASPYSPAVADLLHVLQSQQSPPDPPATADPAGIAGSPAGSAGDNFDPPCGPSGFTLAEIEAQIAALHAESNRAIDVRLAAIDRAAGLRDQADAAAAGSATSATSASLDAEVAQVLLDKRAEQAEHEKRMAAEITELSKNAERAGHI